MRKQYDDFTQLKLNAQHWTLERKILSNDYG